MPEIVDELICPGCQGKEFLLGPRGGMAVNVKCKSCGYVLNVCPLSNGDSLTVYWIVDKLGVPQETNVCL